MFATEKIISAAFGYGNNLVTFCFMIYMAVYSFGLILHFNLFYLGKHIMITLITRYDSLSSRDRYQFEIHLYHEYILYM